MRAAWCRNFHDAVFEAHFRASLVRRRYQVYYDPANRLWNLRETSRLLQGHAEYDATEENS